MSVSGHSAACVPMSVCPCLCAHVCVPMSVCPLMHSAEEWRTKTDKRESERTLVRDSPPLSSVPLREAL